jgi:hypothetical protein
VESDIAGHGHQQAASGISVPSGPTGLLHVGLERRRHTHVRDESDLGVVDPHAEGARGTHDSIAAGGEPGLEPIARRAVQAGVVDSRFPAPTPELVGEPYRSRPRKQVDEGGRSPSVTERPLHGSHDLVETGGVPSRVTYRPVEIRTIDTAQKARGSAKAEAGFDLRSCVRSRGGRERRDGRATRRLEKSKDLTVFRAEVVAPVTDAVRFVHDHASRFNDPRERTDAIRRERFRRKVEQARREVAQTICECPLLGPVQRR